MGKTKTVGKRLFYIAIAAAVILIAMVIPSPEGLSDAGKLSLALIIAGVVLWVTEPMDMAISALLLMILMPVFGILPVMGVWTNFISSVIFFVLASFGFTAALLKTKVPSKIVFALMRLTKGNSKAIVLAFMVATALVSAFISDLPCTALFAGIAVSNILEVTKAEPGKSKFGRALIIGIVFASAIGGWITPAGSSLNVMAMNMLAANTGITITFLDWTIICAPLAIIVLIVAWAWLMLVSKPERLTDEAQAAIQERGKNVGKFDALDWKTIGIMLLLVVLWVASNWTGWDATSIAVLGLVLFFIPGIDVLTWKEFVKSIAWSIVILIGGVQSLAGGIQEQGAASWLLQGTVAAFTAAGGLVVTAAASFFIPIIRCFLPIGPAIIAICLIPMAQIAGTVGVSPVVFAIIVGVNASTAFLMGIDNNPMLTNRYKYWSMGQYFVAGTVPTIALMILCATIVAPIVSFLGY